MKEDDVGLNVKIPEIGDASFQMLEKRGVEARGVPGVRRRAFKWIEWRFVGVPVVVFWKNAEADFIEGGCGQGLQRLRFQRLTLVVPNIAGGAEFFVWHSIGVSEMKGVGHV